MALVFLLLALMDAARVMAYVPMRFVSPTLPPSTWPLNRLPLATLIHSTGSADVSGNADILAVQAAQQNWNSQNTAYFSFAIATTSSSAAVNDSDGINAIVWDESGSFFAPADTTLSATVIRVDLSTGAMQDADVVFNGVAALWSASSPTPSGRYDIQAAATHEMGHVAGLDHNPILSATLYPFLPQASQTARFLASDDRRGLAFLYPETMGQSGFTAPATGEGDLAVATGTLTGQVRTAGGASVHGAHVAALDSQGGVLASALTAPDGSYRITGLPPGTYQLVVADLSGPVVEQDLSAGNADNFFGGFPASFLGGNANPQAIPLSEGTLLGGLDINVSLPHVAESEPNDAWSTSQEASTGVPVSGVLSTASDVDYFSFPASPGDIVLLDAHSGGDGNPLDPVLTLFDPSGMLPLVSVDDTPGKGLDSCISRRFTTGGTYFARVSSAFTEGGAGFSYLFSVQSCLSESEPNGTSAVARDIAFGERRGGVGDPAGDSDWFRFTGRGGDRLFVEVTANRSGSPLDSKLSLVAPDGVTVLATALDTFGKDPALEFTLPPTPTLAAYFLKLESQSGAGAGAWYCLALDRTPLEIKASAGAPLGAGVTGVVTDPFPRTAAPGDNFDLVMAGPSLPADAGIIATGSGVSVTATSGAAYALDAQGRGVKAFSVFVSPSAAPGSRSWLVQDGRGGASVLVGGLVVRAVNPPGEAAAGALTPIHWVSGELAWGSVPGSLGYDLYRGALPGLMDSDGNGVADGYGGLLACGLSEPVVVDSALPAVGSGYFYLVAAFNSIGKGSLGYASNGLPRPAGTLNPACP
jgi:carboxypeptidase family protein/matrixin